MSKCMTIADETVDQKDICIDIAPKEIVEFILEEALLSAVIVSDKGCSRIGDSNITDEFRQQYDQLSLLKDFEQVEPSQAQPSANKDSILNFRENLDRATVTAKENLEQIIDSFVKEEEKTKPLNDCQIITEEQLADNELQIRNGKIHLEKNKTTAEFHEESYYDKKDVIKDEKIEIEYFNEGQLNRIYVPLNGNAEEDNRSNEKKEDEIGLNGERSREDNERPFKPFTTEELRQVWENGNSSLIGKWDGDMLSQREEVVKIMEELSSVQVFPDNYADSSRPRACTLGEEDVKKMTKEIEDINFTQSHFLSEDDVSYYPDGQGDADLETENVEKSLNECFTNHTQNYNSTKEIPSQNYLISPLLNDEKTQSMKIDSPFSAEPSQNEPTKIISNPDLTPDSEMDSLSKKSSQTIQSGSNHQPSQQGTISWSGLKWGSKEALCSLSPNTYLEENHWERISVEYRPLPEEAGEKVQDDDFLRAEGSGIQNGDDVNLVAEKVNERLEDTLVCAKKNVENFEELEERVCENENEIVKTETEDECAMKGGNFDFTKTALSEQQSKQTFNSDDTLSNAESNRDPSGSSQISQTQFSDQSIKGSETLVSGSQKFKLHSPKMYMSPYHEPASQIPNEFNLTESEEAFIDMSENVIQIIDPPDNSADEDSNAISFSLLPENSNLKSGFHYVENKSDASLKSNDFSENQNERETPPKRVYSGMTTIGPMKNLDYDPKDLSAPEIDFGKMTRITTSRQLARDMGLLNAENPALTVKIIEEDDSDDNTTLNLEDDHVDRNSLINRDIASLTKVQKVREVMSHQAKPEEDFDDEESLPRPRLDLKDVESMTDERYKFPDVSIPLLSLEIGERNLEAEKELMESMGLVISGLTNNCFYEDEAESNLNISLKTTGDNETVESILETNKQSSKTESLSVKNEEEEEQSEENLEEKEEAELTETELKEETFENPKHSTLGSVFRKASSKFMRKDSELCMRNSKSLPWDTSKISGTSSIRSIIDDCQSSASSVLKKSCSFLKNTESIFKSISQSMMTTEKSSDSNPGRKKLSPSESDVSTVERKFSGFFRKEDFTKAKNLIKSKVEKTFKSSDSKNSIPENESEAKQFQLAVRNEENLRIDRIENVKKFQPKSPLVYKSQFVKSQMNFHCQPEPLIMNPPALEPIIRETINHALAEGSDAIFATEKVEMTEEPQPKESLQWITKEENVQLPIFENLEPQQPAYIVMETIQGLPASDLESPSSEKENLNVENTGNVTIQKGTDMKKIEASNSIQLLTESSQDTAPSYTDTDEEKTTTKALSERKIKTKKKKLSARFLSFWCSAFGRAKTPQKKGDLS